MVVGSAHLGRIGTFVSEPSPQSDEAYPETPRCASCNECIQINTAMFAYDANKQAYIANVNAGTYRQLVEAAESYQVSSPSSTPVNRAIRTSPGLTSF